MKGFLKLFSLPMAREKAARELHLAELESLAAAENLEYWQAQKSMLEARVLRLRRFTQEGT